jgi:hypothetical protein
VVAAQSRALHVGVASVEVAQKIVTLVVDAIGGSVEDTDCLNLKRHQLSLQLNCVLLPLGLLWVEPPCHRSLLFKVISLTTHLM